MTTQSIRLSFDPSGHETTEATVLSSGLLRLEETPLSATELVHAGDTIEADLEDGVWRFVRVVERAPTRHHSWVVPQGWFESTDGRAYLASVTAAGGSFECAMGGVLHVHVPLERAFDAERELDRYLSSEWPDV